jgi:hypothetical protein
LRRYATGYLLQPGVSPMPEGFRSKSRHADVIGNAGKITRPATGEETEELAPVSAGAALGKLGGQARAWNMTPEARAEQAKKAAAKRWCPKT